MTSRQTTLRPGFPGLPVLGGLIAFAALSALFILIPLDQGVASHYFRQSPPWPGDHRAWSLAFYRFGQAPGVAVGILGGFAFGASFAGSRFRAWRGPGLYLFLLLVLGPGLLVNGLGKALAGRPRPVETLGFGGLWDYQAPFQFGIPGRGLSFLSGHSASIWYFFGFFWLLQGGKRWLSLVATLALGAAMALTRVSQGAHWLSDTVLCGAAIFTLAAALSPLIHWQPSRRFWRRPGLAWALGLGLLAWLSLGHVRYEDRRFVAAIDASTGLPRRLAPQQRALNWAGPDAPVDVAVDVDLEASDLRVRFDQDGPDLPLTLNATFRGQGLPGGHERLSAEPLAPGKSILLAGPQTLGYRFSEALSGLWFSHQGQADLGLPSRLGADLRLHLPGHTLTMGPLPQGRRVLVSRLPGGVSLPEGFQPYGGSAWLREGSDPLISLDIQAQTVIFED